MWAVVLCFFTFFVIILQYYRRRLQFWKKKGIPYEKPVPVFGNILNSILMKETLGDTVRNIYNKHEGPYVGFYILNEPSLLIRDPEIIKHIIVKDFQYFKDRTVVSDESVDPISAHILFSSKSPSWGELRKKVTPIFTSGKLKNMYGLIYENSNDLLNHLKTSDEIVETRDLFAKFTTDVISSTCFGINAHSFTDPNAEFRKVSKRIFDWSSLEISLPMLLYFLAPRIVKLFNVAFLNKKCTKFLKDAFWSTILHREASNAKKNDFVDLLINIKNDNKEDAFKLNDDMVVAQAVQFFVAGFETTSTTISFCLYELAKYPEVQQKLKMEIKELFEKDGHFSYDELKNMKYLDMCVNETLRKYPILPFLDRRCNENYKIPNTNFVIEKNTPVYVSLLGLQFDEKYFPNPDSFIPERWEKAQNNYAYLPFGDGPRNCIGSRFGLITTKLGIARVLNEFSVELCDKTSRNIRMETKGILMSPVGGLHLKFIKDIH